MSDLSEVQQWLVTKAGTVEEGDTNEEIHQYLIRCEKAIFTSSETGESIIASRPDEAFEYVRLKTIIEAGDEVWLYNSGKDSFNCLCGRGGYALIRNGKVKESICTVMS